MYHLKSFGTQSDAATSQTLTLGLSDLNAVRSGYLPSNKLLMKENLIIAAIMWHQSWCFFEEIIAI